MIISDPAREAMARHFQALASFTDDQRSALTIEALVEAQHLRSGRLKDAIRAEIFERRAATP